MKGIVLAGGAGICLYQLEIELSSRTWEKGKNPIING